MTYVIKLDWPLWVKVVAIPPVVKIDVAKVSVRTIQLLPVITNDLNQTIAQKQAKFPARMVEVNFLLSTLD